MKEKRREKRRPSNFLSKEQLQSMRNFVAIQGKDGSWKDRKSVV